MFRRNDVLPLLDNILLVFIHLVWLDRERDVRRILPYPPYASSECTPRLYQLFLSYRAAKNDLRGLSPSRSPCLVSQKLPVTRCLRWNRRSEIYHRPTPHASLPYGYSSLESASGIGEPCLVGAQACSRTPSVPSATASSFFGVHSTSSSTSTNWGQFAPANGCMQNTDEGKIAQTIT